MNGAWAVFRREFGAYFGQPVAYVVIVAYLLICGWFLNATLFLEGQATLRNFFAMVPLILVFFAPALTMRLLAEEWKNGTMELLVTFPLRDIDVVLGKFLAAFAVLAVAQGLTLMYPLTIGSLGNLDGGQVASAYLGTLLLGGALLAVGLWASALTRSQIVAFIVAFFICFGLNMLGKILPLVPGALVPLVELLALDTHFNNMVKGVVDSRDVLYFLSVIAFCLMGTVTTLEGRKWGAG
ncbi:MAG: ABC transporter permease subunit [Nitrospirota bacterium]|nr:ABC transporter permease subunit [Nitrospirota bacterium]